MKLEEAQRLSADWEALDRLDLQDPWPRGWPKAHRTMEYADKCATAHHAYKRHTSLHFDEVVEALERCVKMLQRDGSTGEGADEVLARAKEVKP
jgi:hypothetical protein